MRDLEQLSREKLVEALRQACDGLAPDELNSADRQVDLLRQLRAYQIELEMQNRALRDAERLLEGSRDHYVQLFDFAPVGYLTLDRTGIIDHINLAAAAMLGCERAELTGKPLVATLPRENMRPVLDHLRRCRERQPRVESQWIVQWSDARAAILHVVSVQLTSHMGLTSWPTALVDLSAAQSRAATAH